MANLIGAWAAHPKKVSNGYFYHWKTRDGWEGTFRDRELLTLDQQKKRVKEMKKGWDASQAIQTTLAGGSDEAEGRRKMIDRDPLLKDDLDFWATSWAELKAHDKYGDD